VRFNGKNDKRKSFKRSVAMLQKKLGRLVERKRSKRSVVMLLRRLGKLVERKHFKRSAVVPLRRLGRLDVTADTKIILTPYTMSVWGVKIKFKNNY
jgi:hypothetical protein